MCFVCLSEETVTFALYIINRLVFITEVESAYCVVHTESLHNTGMSCPYRVKDVVYTKQAAHALSTNPNHLISIPTDAHT